MSYESFHSVDLRRLVEYADRTVAAAVDLLLKAGKPDKRGGYLAVLEIGRGNLEILLRIGHSPQDKVDKRIEVAIEKCKRLHGNGHLTSYESRNPEVGCWGGAVRGSELIFSFSGLPELWDEAAMFVLAIRLHQLRESDVLAQISEERNPYLRPLLEATHRTE